MYEDYYLWCLSLLHKTEDDIEIETLEPFIKSALRYFQVQNAEFKAAFLADEIDEDDQEILDEAVGYKSVALWLMSVPADDAGNQVILQEELANGLLEKYQGWSVERVAASLERHAQLQFDQISYLVTANETASAGRRYFRKASPTRANNLTSDTIFGKLLVGEDSEF